MPSAAPTLGALLRSLRAREGWTLKEMSAKSGIPVSTLSKVEHDRLTLTYDKLYQLSRRLGLRMSELFAEGDTDVAPPVTARRSLGSLDTAIRVETPNYDYYYLCTELRRKRMIPVITKIRAKTEQQFGELVHHAGEEYIYVLRGRHRRHHRILRPGHARTGPVDLYRFEHGARLSRRRGLRRGGGARRDVERGRGIDARVAVDARGTARRRDRRQRHRPHPRRRGRR